jgi:hypothetical protein
VTERDRLEAYTAALRFEARRHVSASGDLVADLLEEVAEGCDAAGSSLIGHIKCHARSEGRVFSCSLTSRRTGATCRGARGEPLVPGATLEVDLAVLVYGLPWEAVDAQVRRALRTSEERHDGRWEHDPHHPHGHAHDAC